MVRHGAWTKAERSALVAGVCLSASVLGLIGILSPQDLLGKDPYTLQDDLCRTTGVRHDLCELDTFIAAVRFMAGEPSKPWWKYTAERKRTLASMKKETS